jgi:hypothetical protein
VIATELPENHNSPIRQVSPYLYPEVVRKLFPYHFSEAIPVGWIEHQPPLQPEGDCSSHTYELVVFDRYTPKMVFERDRYRVRIGNSNHSLLTKEFMTRVLERDPEAEDPAERLRLQHKRQLT